MGLTGVFICMLACEDLCLFSVSTSNSIRHLYTNALYALIAQVAIETGWSTKGNFIILAELWSHP